MVVKMKATKLLTYVPVIGLFMLHSDQVIEDISNNFLLTLFVIIQSASIVAGFVLTAKGIW